MPVVGVQPRRQLARQPAARPARPLPYSPLRLMPLPLEEVLARTRSLAAEVLQPRAAAVDQEARWPEEGLRALQRDGLGGLVVPAQAGGSGHGLLALAQVCEALGRACGATAICFGMHCVGAAVLAAKATPDQVERYLQPIARGEHLTTLALSEPGTGAHFYLPQTSLRRVADDLFQLNGAKTFVTNGSHADSYVLSTVAADPDAPPGTFSCVVVPNDAPGLVWGPPWQGFGMRGNDARQATLQAVPVPRADLLGEEGDQLWYVFEVVAPYFLMAMAGTYLGIATAALDEARSHLGQRVHSHSGVSLGQQPVVQHRLGVLWGQVERTRQLIYAAAALGDAGDPAALPALLTAKAEVGDCVVAVTNEAMTLTGGIAYRENAALARALRDARAAPVMAPPTDLLRTWAGRALLGLPLLGD